MIDDSTTYVFQGIRVPTSGPGLWPGRPLHVGDRMTDAEWQALGLPDTVGSIDIRALLEREFEVARDAIKFDKKRATAKDLGSQLREIRGANVGDPLPKNVHENVLGLLSGMALLDPRFGRGDPSAIKACQAYVHTQSVVTEPFIGWARQCLRLGAGRRSHYRFNGSATNYAERVFVGVLITFWTGTLKREVTNWVGGSGSDEIASPLVRFVHRSLNHVGARLRPQHLPRKRGPKHSHDDEPKLELNLEDVRQRIDRARTEMDAAREAGLQPNVLSRMLNT